MITLRRSYFAAIMVVGSAVPLTAAEKSAVPFRAISYDDAAKAATTEHKFVFIDFYTTWCGPCKMLDAQTWTDAAVGELVGAKTVPLRMDAEKEGSALAKKYAIRAYPTMLLLKPDGTEVDPLIGFERPDKFVADFNQSLIGKNALARAQEAANAAAEDNVDQQVETRNALARQLMLSGKYEQALAEYLWLYDTGMKNAPAFAGVRNSFLTGEMGHLVRAYPPAQAALKQRRDDAKQRMLGGERRAALEFGALNDALGDNTATLAAFDALPAGDPRRHALGMRIYQQLVTAKRYTDALEGQPYPMMVRMLNDRVPALPNVTPEVRTELRRLTLKTAATNIETLAGAGQVPDAVALIKDVLKIDSSEETRQSIHEHLIRAGHPELLDQASAAP